MLLHNTRGNDDNFHQHGVPYYLLKANYYNMNKNLLSLLFALAWMLSTSSVVFGQNLDSLMEKVDKPVTTFASDL